MADKTKIEWTDETWNPIVGCTQISPGCANCYAMEQAARQIRCSHGLERDTHYEGTVRDVGGRAVWTGKIAEAPEHVLFKPLHWKKPRRVFVNSMSDLFHEDVTDEMLDRIFAVMALCPQHTFQVLTKRPERMRVYASDPETPRRVAKLAFAICRKLPRLWPSSHLIQFCLKEDDVNEENIIARWPLPNVWLGVTAENQEMADKRIPILLVTPAALYWVSVEPMLGYVDLTDIAWAAAHLRFPASDDISDSFDALRYTNDRQGKLAWVVGGFESGRKARPGQFDCARALRDQCAAADVAFLWKQNGEFVESDEPACRVCGCTEFNACPGGCSWVEPDLCSACVGMEQPAQRAMNMNRVGKKAAGRLLDGALHDAYPETRQ